jgi:hypothetical protein
MPFQKGHTKYAGRQRGSRISRADRILRDMDAVYKSTPDLIKRFADGDKGAGEFMKLYSGLIFSNSKKVEEDNKPVVFVKRVKKDAE